MKILILSNEYPVDFLGGGYVIRNIFNGLSRLGHTAELYSPADFLVLSKRIHFAKRYRLAIGMLILVMSQWKQFKQFETIVFLGGVASLSMLFVKKMGYKGKIVHFSNGPEIKYFDIGVAEGVNQKKWYTIPESILSHFSFELPDLIVTVSKDDKDWLLERGFPKIGEIVAINPGLSENFLDLNLKGSKRGKVIGFCGNWIPPKGISLITKVIPEILLAHPDWEFWVLGDRYPEMVQSAFPTTVTSRIKVFPFMEKKGDLLALYRQVAIQIMPSYYESFGLVMLEAMACGCALITNRVGLGYELVSGEHALIMEEKTEQALYESLQVLINDAELRERLSRGGHDFAQKFTWERAICELEGALHQLQES